MLPYDQRDANSSFNQGNQMKNKFATSNDLLYFKEEILKDLKEIETKQQTKFNTFKEQANEKLQYTEQTIELLKTKIIELTTTISKTHTNNENITKILFNQSKMDEKLTTLEINVRDLNINYSDSIFSLNKVIQDKLTLPGLIGVNSKFPTFHSLIDYILSNIKNLVAFKEKMTTNDMKNYRAKLDILINNMRNQIDNFVNTSNNFTIMTMGECEKRFAKLFREHENKINDLQKNSFEFSENIEDFKEKIKVIELVIDQKIQEAVNKMRNTMNDLDNNITAKNINGNINNVQDILNILIAMDSKIQEYTKNFSLKINAHKELLYKLYKNEYQSSFNSEYEFQKVFDKIENLRYPDTNLNKSLELENNNELQDLRKISSTESVLKKYIEGEINLEDLRHHRQKKESKTQILKNLKFRNKSMQEKSLDYSQIIHSIYNNAKQRQEDENNIKNTDIIISKIRRMPKRNFTYYYKKNFNETGITSIRDQSTKIKVVNLGEEENPQKISNQ